MKIGIVTDSASDIDKEFAEKHNIKVVPIMVTYYGKSYKEDFNYDFNKHFEYYNEDKDFLPKTTQPKPSDFLDAYNELANEEVENIIVVCISSALSGTLNSANAAAQLFEESNDKIKVHIIDSLNASYAEGFLLEEALDLIKKKQPVEFIVSMLKSLVKNIKSYILLPTLRYLRLGGRISLPRYVLARLLNKKVITGVNEAGELKPARTYSNIDDGLQQMIELVQEEEKEPRKIAIVYANDHSLKDKMIDLVKKAFPKASIRVTRTRVSISAHVGPRAMALVTDFGYND